MFIESSTAFNRGIWRFHGFVVSFLPSPISFSSSYFPNEIFSFVGFYGWVEWICEQRHFPANSISNEVCIRLKVPCIRYLPYEQGPKVKYLRQPSEGKTLGGALAVFWPTLPCLLWLLWIKEIKLCKHREKPMFPRLTPTYWKPQVKELPALQNSNGCLRLRATMQNRKNGKAFLSQVVPPRRIFLFLCPEGRNGGRPLLKRLPWRLHGGGGHSLPHLSSQCQEQSKQNKSLEGRGVEATKSRVTSSK